MLIYKILLPSEWAAFEAAGTFDGSPYDHESGFIHLSSREQLAGTARRFFAGQSPLVIAVVEADAVTGSLRWEAAPDGAIFPHLYGVLPRASVTATMVADDADEVDAIVPT